MAILVKNRIKKLFGLVCFSILFVVSPVSGFAQEWLQKANSLALKKQYEQAIKIAEPYVNTLPEDTIRVGLMLSLGTWYGYTGNIPTSTRFYEKSLALESKLPYKRSKLLAYLYNNLAYNYDLLYQSDQVVSFYKKAHELWFEKDYQNITDNITAFGNLIPALLGIGLLKEAEFYFKRFQLYVHDIKVGKLNLALDTLNAMDKANRLMYIQLTSVRYYAAINDQKGLKQALFVFDSLHKEKHRPEDVSMYLEALDNVGYTERFKGDYKKALFWYKKADMLAHNDFYRMKGAANQAVTYYYAGEAANALFFAQKALSFLPAEASSLSAFGLRAMSAELQIKLQNVDAGIRQLEALYTMQLKRPVLMKDFLHLNITDVDNYLAPQQISILLFSGNGFKLKYDQQKNVQDIKIAHHFYELAAEVFNRYYALEGYSDLMDYFRKELNGKLLETGQLSGLNSKAWISLFNKLENNTSQRTWKKFLNAHSMQLGVPGEWLGLRMQLLAEKTTGKGAGLKESAERVANASKSLDSLDLLIHKKAPRFLTFDTAAASVKDLVDKLSKDQGILRYFTTNQYYYGILLYGDSIIVKRLGETEYVNTAVKKWVSSVRNPQANSRSFSIALWQNILAPFYPAILKNKSLTIIPDGALSLLAFEPLFVEAQSDFHYKFPVISYGFDVKMLQLQQVYRKESSSLIAFAPKYKDRKESVEIVKRGGDYYALPGAQEEAAEVADLLKGKIFFGKNANLKNFLDAVGNYGVYHLAMHAEMDTLNYERSSLVFSEKERIYFNELYAKPFDAEMIVLSACNTGAGLINPGEGVMSISRALAYSGVQSAVYALWEVPDAETSWIIKSFYKGLKNGLPKHEALASAKALFIETFPEKSHPFFWAGLVINGNTEPLKFGHPVYLWFLLLIPLIIIGIWYSRNKN